MLEITPNIRNTVAWIQDIGEAEVTLNTPLYSMARGGSYDSPDCLKYLFAAEDDGFDVEREDLEEEIKKLDTVADLMALLEKQPALA